MRKPVLVILAAGLGNRFGGGSAKQIAHVDNNGHAMIDFSIYDAMLAGFSDVVCVINEEMEADFHARIGAKVGGFVNLSYAYQRLNMLPPSFAIPPARVKPWGTAHAALCAKDFITGPFAVINADDYYGRNAYASMFGFLSAHQEATEHAMIGYAVENTVSPNGSVARGVCEVTADGKLMSVRERTHIVKHPDGAAYSDDGEHFVVLPKGTVVSMNFWGFQRAMLDDLEERFSIFLQEDASIEPLRAECYLPTAVNQLLQQKRTSIRVIITEENWYGVTYKEDVPAVQAAFIRMRQAGMYPASLWKRA